MRLRKIVIAPDSFKGTVSASEAANIIEKGIHYVSKDIETIKLPIADGGEGTVDFFLEAIGGKKITITVTGPSFAKIEASYALLKDNKTAVIETAAAAGLSLMSDDKDPSKTTTYGLGELMLDALNRGCKKLIVGLGGSATNDGGIGMAAALGVRFLDKDNKIIALNGAGLALLHHIDLSELDKRLSSCILEVACDVDNPLYGENGAAYTFSPQKGADDEMVRALDNNLKNYASVLQNTVAIDVQTIPGSGAAGGLGAGLIALTNAILKPGIEIMLDTVRFDEIIKDADLIITGEGKIDGQSLRGKVPIGIVRRAKKYDVPVIAIVGAIGDSVDEIYKAGIKAVFSINRQPLDFSIAKNYTNENLLRTTESIIRFGTIFS